MKQNSPKYQVAWLFLYDFLPQENLRENHAMKRLPKLFLSIKRAIYTLRALSHPKIP
jgi:hypothetical protein